MADIEPPEPAQREVRATADAADPLVRYQDIVAAADRLRGEAVRTPLLRSAILDATIGGQVLLKPETLQRTGSFKFRGAYNRLSLLTPDVRSRGVVACSSGNHAQGVAEAARLFGVPATIVMPSDAPAVKRQRTERSGARVIGYDRAHEDRDAIAAAIATETGATLVSPFEDAEIIAGQGTVGLEILDDLDAWGVRADTLAVPTSGGGLAAGIAIAFEAHAPGTRLLTAEPEGFDDHRRSLAAGKIVANAPGASSIGDALLLAQPGTNTFSINRTRLAGGVAVSDDEMRAAIRFAALELKLVVEPGGAAGLAALLAGKLDAGGRTTVIVLSGGNIDPTMLAAALCD